MAGFLSGLPGIRARRGRQPVAARAAAVTDLDGAAWRSDAPARGASRWSWTTSRCTSAGLKAIDGVSLTVEPGQVHGLIGPNGSGKSTMVNCVTGVYRPTGGDVRLGDARAERPAARTRSPRWA